MPLKCTAPGPGGATTFDRIATGLSPRIGIPVVLIVNTWGLGQGYLRWRFGTELRWAVWFWPWGGYRHSAVTPPLKNERREGRFAGLFLRGWLVKHGQAVARSCQRGTADLLWHSIYA